MIKMKKNCNGCKAFWIKNVGSSLYPDYVSVCQLGHEIKESGIWDLATPTETCPKPRTHKKLEELLRGKK